MFKLLKTKLRLRLIFWIVFDITIAMLVVSVINIKTSYDNTLTLAGRNYANMAEEVAVFVDNKISSVQLELSIITQMNEIGNPAVSKDERVNTARTAANIFGDNVSIHLTDLNGMELVLAGETAANLSGEDYIKDALSGKVHVTAPFYHADTDRMVMVIAQPVHWNGQVIGTIFMQMSEEFINETIVNVKTGHQGYACIFDSKGFMVAHKDIKNIVQSGRSSYIELAKTDAAYKDMAEAMSTMIKEQSGSITYINDTGQKKLGGFSTTKNGWVVLVNDAVSEINTDASSSVIRSIIGALICLALVISIAPKIMSKITGPINFISRILDRVGSNGDLTLSSEEKQELLRYTTKVDEIGTCAKALEGHIKHLQGVEHILGRLSEGDLTVEVKQLTDRDNIAVALTRTMTGLNKMFSEIRQSAAVVSSGSDQISLSSNTLAQAASEQSAATEELSSAITEITIRTDENTALSYQAANLSEQIRTSAEKGSQQMNKMMSAIQEINEAGQSINKVIKVIEDIAFQTNILALNAAVEAAHAGQHGKGFSVVAEEVRSLASKSADAAKNTSSLIVNSVEKAEIGAHIAKETAISLAEIVKGINESNRLLANIARSTGEQSQVIAEISKNSEHMSQIAQETAATAEQSAAAAEEMNSQAVTLDEYVKQFKLND